MENVEIYIKLIEGTDMLVPVKASKIDGLPNLYLIESNEQYDSEDFTSIWEFIPGDVVECIDCSKDVGLVGKRLVHSDVPERTVFELMYLITNQNAKLYNYQTVKYTNEIEILKKKVGNQDNLYHPLINYWFKESGLNT